MSEPSPTPESDAALGRRAQILATEHWRLLAARSTAQSEVLTRSVSILLGSSSVLLFVVNACVFGLFAGAIVVSAGGAVGWAITVGVLVGLGLIAGLFWYSGAGFRGAWRRYVPRRQTPPGPPPYWRS